MDFEAAVKEIKPGRYRHFSFASEKHRTQLRPRGLASLCFSGKGNEYEVLYIARHSETAEPMVVYRALYGDNGVWLRPADMWNETVERDEKTYLRFTRIDP